MASVAYPDTISELFPEAFESATWKVEVLTDAFTGSLMWVHFMSALDGPQAWRVASSTGHTFRTPVRVTSEQDSALTYSSED